MTVKIGDKVAVHYTGWLEDGTMFDSSVQSKETFKFQVGKGMVIQGFDEAVIGMEVGEKKKITVTPEAGYGERSEKYVLETEKKNFPPDAQIEIGSIFEMHSDKGDVIPVRIVEVKEDTVVLDANHPLAGKTLTFEIELVQTDVDIPDFEHDHHGCCCGNEDCDDDCDDKCDDDENCNCGCGHSKKD